MTRVEVHHGRVTSRLASPSAEISNVIRCVVPSSAREYSPHDGVWVIYASQIDRLLAALHKRGVKIVEIGGMR